MSMQHCGVCAQCMQMRVQADDHFLAEQVTQDGKPDAHGDLHRCCPCDRAVSRVVDCAAGVLHSGSSNLLREIKCGVHGVSGAQQCSNML